MYSELIHAIDARPAPYAPMAHPFWDDPYLSRQFLQAHLAPDQDAATRAHAFVERSAEWIATLAQGRLLDLGCGPGLYAEQFARRGFQVTGIDLSQTSIDHAKASAALQRLPIVYRRENYLSLSDVDAYDIITLIYCDYGVLSPDDRQRLLIKAYRALKPGGKLVLDAWTPKQYAAFEEGLSIEHAPQGGFWSPDAYLAIKRNARYPGQIYLERYHVVTAGCLRVFNVWNAAFDRYSLGAELLTAGFSHIEPYSDVAGAPFDANQPTICVVAEK